MAISRAEYENMQPQIQWLMEQLRLSRQKRFGASSEQTSKEAMEQLSLLFNEAEVCAGETASGAKSSAVIFSPYPDCNGEWVRPVPLPDLALILRCGDGRGPVTKCPAFAALECSCCLQNITFFPSQVKTWLGAFLWREV